jgi:hypothetical protein
MVMGLILGPFVSRPLLTLSNHQKGCTGLASALLASLTVAIKPLTTSDAGRVRAPEDREFCSSGENQWINFNE